MKWLLFLPVLLISLVGLSLYLVKTFDVNTEDTVEIIHPECIIDDGVFSREYYMGYSLLPSKNTQPDVVYRVVLDNGYVVQEDKVVWNKVELEIGKAKLIRHEISQDEYEVIGAHPRYDVTVTEVRSERNANYLMWPVFYLGVLVLGGITGMGLIGGRINWKR